MSLTFGTAAYLLPMLFCLEVYGIATGALNTAQGCAIEAQECFAAARAAQFAFNHDALSFLKDGAMRAPSVSPKYEHKTY